MAETVASGRQRWLPPVGTLLAAHGLLLACGLLGAGCGGDEKAPGLSLGASVPRQRSQADPTAFDPARDPDRDGVAVEEDNCPAVSNRDQLDLDGDGVGDACDADSAVCAHGSVSAERSRGSLYFLLDASGSMRATDVGESATRWERVQAALDTVAARTVRDFDVGLALFPDPTTAPDALCDPPLEILKLGDYARDKSAFERAYRAFSAPQFGTHTPTALALDALRERLEPALQRSSGTPAVVLLTDGAPNAPGAPYACDAQVEDKRGAEAAAKRLAKLGITVYVVGMSEGVQAAHLQAMANAGTPGFRVQHGKRPYYTATRAEELEQAFDAIRADAVQCSFELSETGEGVANLERLRVVLDRDGNPNTPGDDSVLADTAYELEGKVLGLLKPACAAFRKAVVESGSAAVRVLAPCEQAAGDAGTCLPLDEVCNGVDDDCNGLVDEGCASVIH